MSYPNVRRTEQYANDVIGGKIIANKWLKLACERHFNDKKAKKSKDYPYKFNPA